jgi:hypothetical protein
MWIDLESMQADQDQPAISDTCWKSELILLNENIQHLIFCVQLSPILLKELSFKLTCTLEEWVKLFYEGMEIAVSIHCIYKKTVIQQ